MTDQIITITGLEFTTEGRPIAHGAIIREGAGTLEETMKAGGAQMGTLHPMDGCPMGRVEAKFAGQTATAVFFGERFLLAVFRTEVLTPKRLWFRSENLYATLVDHAIGKERLSLD